MSGQRRESHFDNNYRPRLWTDREETQQVYRMLECTDIAFLTLDVKTLWGQQPVEGSLPAPMRRACRRWW